MSAVIGALSSCWLEQSTHNRLVRGSTPRGPTKFSPGGEMVDTGDLKSPAE